MRRCLPWLLLSALVAAAWLLLRRADELVAPAGPYPRVPQAAGGEAAKAPTLIAAAPSESNAPAAATAAADREWEEWWQKNGLANQPVAIVGRVTRRDGTPAAGMWVRAMRADPSYGGAPTATSTDPEGRYELRGLDLGLWRIVARGGGWVAASLSDNPSAPRANDPYLAVVTSGPAVRVDIVVERAARVVGRVVGPEAKLVPGATVEALPDVTGGGSVWDARLDTSPDPCETTTAGADGGFTLDSLVPDSTYRLRARSPEHLSSLPHAMLAVLGEPLPVELALRTGRWIEVTVVDDEGRPVPGVEVRAFQEHSSRWEPGAGRREARTSTAGAARLGPFEAQPVDVGVYANGYVDSASRRTSADWTVPPSESTITIRLSRGLSIAGRVLGPGGAPAPRTQVQAQLRSTHRGGRSISGLRSVETDDTGSFRIGGLPEGRITLDAIQRDSSPPWVGLLEVDAGAVDVVLQLEQDSRHVVLKILGPDGQPIPHALVQHLPMAAQEAHNGRFEIESTHLDLWDLDVVIFDARDAEGKPLGLAPARLTLPKGRGGETDVRLAPGSTIAGCVVDEQGDAIPGALVHAEADAVSGGGDEEYAPATRTAQDGTFRIASLGDGPHILNVAPPEPFVAIVPQSVVAGTEDLRLVLRRGVSALVTVLDGEGRPVPGAGVYLQGGDAQDAGGVAIDDLFDQMLGLPYDASGWEVFRTGVMGTVRLPPLDPEQSYRVRVVGPREGADLAWATRSDWRPAATTVRLARSWTVTGLVQDEQGLPMPGALVHARTESAAQRIAIVDAEGRFKVRQLEAGAVVLSAKAGGGASLPEGPEVRARGGDQDVVLVAPAGQTLLVTVEGLPAGECELEAFLELEQRSPQDWDPVVWGSAVDARTVRFRHLESTKTYTLWIRPCERALDLSAWVTGVRGAGRDLRVRLQPGRTVRGRLLGLPDGIDLDRVSLEAMRGSLTLDAAVQEDGRFEIRGLPDGDWTLRAQAWVGNDEVYTGKAQVAAGGSVEIPMKSSSDEPAGR